MATNVPNLVGIPVPLQHAKTNERLTIVRAIDITADCPCRKNTIGRVEICYTWNESRLMVIIRYANKPSGPSVNCIVCNIDQGLAAEIGMDHFRSFTRYLGVTAEVLEHLVVFHSPGQSQEEYN